MRDEGGGGVKRGEGRRIHRRSLEDFRRTAIRELIISSCQTSREGGELLFPQKGTSSRWSERANVARDTLLPRVETVKLHNSFYREQMRDQSNPVCLEFFSAILRENFIIHVNVCKSVWRRRLPLKIRPRDERVWKRFSRAQNVINIYFALLHIRLLRGKLSGVQTDVYIRQEESLLFSRPSYKSFIPFIFKAVYHAWCMVFPSIYHDFRNWITLSE